MRATSPRPRTASALSGSMREHLRVRGRRPGHVLLLDGDGRERQQRLRERRVLADRALEHQRGVLRAAGEAQVVAEHHGVLGGERAPLLELAQVADGGLVTAGRGVGHGARAQHHEHARVLGEEGGELADGLLGLGPRHGHAVAAEPGHEADPVLGVAARGGRARAASRADVAEGRQPLGGLRVHRLRGARRASCVIARCSSRRIASTRAGSFAERSCASAGSAARS